MPTPFGETIIVSKGGTIPRQVKCECGYVARGETDDDVLAEIRDHLRSDHPQLLEAVTDEQIRDWIEIVA